MVFRLLSIDGDREEDEDNNHDETPRSRTMDEELVIIVLREGTSKTWKDCTAEVEVVAVVVNASDAAGARQPTNCRRGRSTRAPIPSLKRHSFIIVNGVVVVAVAIVGLCCRHGTCTRLAKHHCLALGWNNFLRHSLNTI